MKKGKWITDYVKEKYGLDDNIQILGVNCEKNGKRCLIEIKGDYYVIEDKKEDCEFYRFLLFPNYYEAYRKLFERE